MLLVFFTSVLFLSIQSFLLKKHAIGFKTRLKIGQSCKKNKIENQNKNFEKNLLFHSKIMRRTIKTLQYFLLHTLVFVNAHDITHS